jgi:hypothetical protein
LVGGVPLHGFRGVQHDEGIDFRVPQGQADAAGVDGNEERRGPGAALQAAASAAARARVLAKSRGARGGCGGQGSAAVKKGRGLMQAPACLAMTKPLPPSTVTPTPACEPGKGGVRTRAQEMMCGSGPPTTCHPAPRWLAPSPS